MGSTRNSCTGTTREGARELPTRPILPPRARLSRSWTSVRPSRGGSVRFEAREGRRWRNRVTELGWCRRGMVKEECGS
jgi:hypothetical protein